MLLTSLKARALHSRGSEANIEGKKFVIISEEDCLAELRDAVEGRGVEMEERPKRIAKGLGRGHRRSGRVGH